MEVLYICNIRHSSLTLTADVTLENLNLTPSSLGLSYILLSPSILTISQFIIISNRGKEGQESKNETPTYHLEALIPVSPFF